MFCESHSTQIEEFKKKGVSVEYHSPNLTISSPSVQDVQFFLDLIETYTERELCCTPDKWNSLVMVDKLGKRQMDELVSPFRSHPLVKIIEQPLKLRFVGKKDAVDSAYEHFFKHLNKELKVDRFVGKNITLIF